MYWTYKKKTYDLNKMTVESFVQLTKLSEDRYYELTGKKKPEKKVKPIEVVESEIREAFETIESIEEPVTEEYIEPIDKKKTVKKK